MKISKELRGLSTLVKSTDFGLIGVPSLSYILGSIRPSQKELRFAFAGKVRKSTGRAIFLRKTLGHQLLVQAVKSSSLAVSSRAFPQNEMAGTNATSPITTVSCYKYVRF